MKGIWRKHDSKLCSFRSAIVFALLSKYSNNTQPYFSYRLSVGGLPVDFLAAGNPVDLALALRLPVAFAKCGDSLACLLTAVSVD